MMADASPPVVIVGAGLAGLSCAGHLHANVEKVVGHFVPRQSLLASVGPSGRSSI